MFLMISRLVDTMKLIDALRNVKRDDETFPEANEAPMEEICQSLGMEYDWHDTESDKRIRSYGVLNWVCTDTHVGFNAIYVDGSLAGMTYQSARKSDVEVKWLSQEIAETTRRMIMSNRSTPEYDIINPDEEIDEFYTISFATELLTDDGFYEDRPVRVLIRFYGHMTTPVQYRHEGRSYCVGTKYGDENHNTVLIQDGDEQRLIPIGELKLRININR